MSKGLKRVAARGVVAVALTAGAVVGAVGSASAATPMYHHHAPQPKAAHCKTVPGHWERVWHQGSRDEGKRDQDRRDQDMRDQGKRDLGKRDQMSRDRDQRAHAGYWTYVWQPAHHECRR
ncbi:hypothetical protein [Actinacidiphila acidipaludis]|uniref:Secreted protein n=1 Tax=Actinacidiphila acidipaludis TaxID=2873382 RepID=A0ABS7PZ56_9ACTN|nr:hypothetical protein [Streptomyces acidipaludis]MBY8876170.1 hypothetical protein [Streptomyces acidipaludis]